MKKKPQKKIRFVKIYESTARQLEEIRDRDERRSIADVARDIVNKAKEVNNDRSK